MNAPSIAAINVRGPDGLVARKQGATWTYYTFDQQGNVSQRLDSSGAAVSCSVYDAYGAETTTGTAPTDACGYNAQWGYWLDRDTGLYLCQARWYDPVTGRWVTRDPIGYAGGANLYGYCGGGPVGWADPSGLRKTGSYWGDVGQVFVGYFNFAKNAVLANLSDPLGISRARAFFADPVGTLAAMWEGAQFWNTDDPAVFGERFAPFIPALAGGCQSLLSRGAAAATPASAGRLGGPLHRAAVRATADDLLAANPTWSLKSGGGGPEAAVRIPSNGNLRFPDVHFDTPGGPVFAQIGRSTKTQAPVARELPAIGDLTELGPVIWVPYR